MASASTTAVFLPPVLPRELIVEGRLGKTRHARAAYLQDWITASEAPKFWRLRAETAGTNALGDIASHTIDQIQFLTGQTILEASGC